MKKRICFRRGCCLGIALAQAGIVARYAGADVITPVSDFASSYYTSPQSPTHLIDNSGLDTSSGNVLNYTAAADGSANNMWHAGAGQGVGGAAPVVANQYVVFDLGADYDLTSAYLWQMIQTNLLGRGIQQFSLYGSSAAPNAGSAANPPATYDLSGYTQILGTSTLVKASGSTTPTQAFTLSNAAGIRTVYLQIDSDWNNAANDYVGLSEIKFEGTPVGVVLADWTNTAGGDWETGGNWSTGTVPDAHTNIAFNANAAYTATLSSDLSIGTLTLNGGTPTIAVDHAALNVSSLSLQNGEVVVKNSGVLHSDGDASVGAGTTLRIDGSAATVGSVNQMNGNLIFTNGGTLQSVGNIAAAAGTITVEGNHSDLTVGGNLALGGVSTTGSLHITDGGAVHADTVTAAGGLYLLQNAAITVDGPGSTLTTTGTGNFILGQHSGSTGSLSITRGGVVTLNSGLVYVGDSSGTGNITVDGAGSQLKIAGAMSIGDRGGRGSLTITNGALVDNWTADTDMGYAYNPAGAESATLTIGKADGTDTGGTLMRTRQLRFGQSSTAVGTLNLYQGGTLELNTGGLYASRSPATQINIAGGTIKTPYLYTYGASYLHWTAGTIWLTDTAGNYVDQVGASTDTLIIPTGGTLKGTGSINNPITNLGTISAGDDHATGLLSMGALTIGDLNTQGELDAKIDLATGSTDLLQVAGDVGLVNAKLSVSLLNASGELTTPQTYLLVEDLASGSSVNGIFMNIDLSGLSNYRYTIDYAFSGTALNGIGDGNDIAITFQSIPEPGSAALLSIVSAALLRRRRSAV